MSRAYNEFLASKSQLDSFDGFEPEFLPSELFQFQRELVSWAVRKGRAAIFADCGMGKSLMELVWAANVVARTGGRVLLLTPLAVGAQMAAEGAKFGISAHLHAKPSGPGIYVSNYERLHHYSPSDFEGVVCDESSILKCFDGVTKAAVTEFMRTRRFRLLCTATAAPNDFVELGTSSEALGYLGHMDMLNKFFVNDQNTSDTGRKFAAHGGGKPTWRFKGHAELPFWRWVCSWARAARRPSDLGPFDDSAFELPALVERETIVKSERPRAGSLFTLEARGLSEQRAERRHTVRERCEAAAELVLNTGEPAVCWVTLNDEGDLLEKLVPGSVQVSGRDSDDEKEEKLTSFGRGGCRVLITKPSIGAWGLNWQHCAHMTLFADYSFEQYYQCVRRCWRFGQTRSVVVDHVRSDGEGEVLASRKRKAEQTEKMFAELVRLMRDGLAIDRTAYGTKKEEVPSWL